jgi:hypothetical protein
MSSPFDPFLKKFPSMNNLERGMFIVLSLRWLDGEERNKSAHAFFDLLRFQEELREIQHAEAVPEGWCELIVTKYGAFDFFQSFVQRLA